VNEPAAIPHGHDAANILLVDDQPARLLTYRAILEPLGHNLVAVNSGLEALEALMKQEFAVVLLDVKMPGMDGFETAQLIHDHPRFESTPIIFVTGVHVTEFDRLKGYKAGAIDYVYIPVVPEILRSKVAVLIELDRQRRALQGVNRQLADSIRKLEQANSALQTEKTRELEEVNARLQKANVELSRSNESLETEIRERIRAEKSLKEAVVKRDEFLAMLSHELRNPLSPLRNAAHLLTQAETQDPKIVWSRGVIARQLKHMIRLVDDLLDVSRIARGKIVLVSEPVKVSEVVAAAVETVQPLLEQKRQRLTIETTDPELTVRGDPVRLAQVVGNLLHNAAKYTGDGWNITLVVRGTRKSWCATRESVSHRRPCRASSNCSPRFRATERPRAAVSASAWRWCVRWWNCTVARSTRAARELIGAANSSYACRCSGPRSSQTTRRRRSRR
jgi:signal transduction histidine kinase